MVSIRGNEWHCVGVDEAHEMLINRACKTSIVHPSKDYITRISNYFPYKARCIQNIKKELQLENNAQNSEKSLISEKSSDKKSEANIKSQINYSPRQKHY